MIEEFIELLKKKQKQYDHAHVTLKLGGVMHELKEIPAGDSIIWEEVPYQKLDIEVVLHDLAGQNAPDFVTKDDKWEARMETQSIDTELRLWCDKINMDGRLRWKAFPHKQYEGVLCVQKI